MSARQCAHYFWRGGDTVPQMPWEPEPDASWTPPVVPEQAGRQGDRWLVRVAEFPSGRDLGVLWDARVESVSERMRELGGNQVTISAPANAATMRMLGDPIGTSGRYSLAPMVARELLVGCSDTGLVRWRFVVRDVVQVSAGRIEVSGVGFIGGVTRDRVIGAPTRLNLLGDSGQFGPTLAGWTHVGPGTSGTASGGVDDSGYYAWIKGVPGQSWLQRSIRWQLDAQPWQVRQWFGAQAHVWLPSGLDLDGYGLLSLAVQDRATGQMWWDFRQPQGDPEMGLVDTSMPTGQWVSDGPVTARGLLPRPPYDVNLIVRLHALHGSQETRFDDVRIVRPENTSTVIARDLVEHPRALFDHAQGGRDKSSWGVNVTTGAASGTVELGRWFHEDGQSMDEALAGVCDRGVEVWDLAGPSRTVRCAKRRGSVRHDVVLNQWDVLGRVSWQSDPGAQRSSARATSAAGGLWGGSDEGAINTTQSRGQVIDVVLSGPVGVTPAQLQQWLDGQLSSLMLLPTSATVLVSASWARRVTVGDTLRVRLSDDAAGLVDWVRISQMVWSPDRGIVAIDFGTDPELGGRS